MSSTELIVLSSNNWKFRNLGVLLSWVLMDIFDFLWRMTFEIKVLTCGGVKPVNGIAAFPS
jgi:hypothetical protein